MDILVVYSLTFKVLGKKRHVQFIHFVRITFTITSFGGKFMNEGFLQWRIVKHLV